jgi:hypothetical protein
MTRSAVPLTQKLAHATAWDEGNRSMRRNRRSEWGEADFNRAADTYNNLMRHLLDPKAVARMDRALGSK